MALLLVLICTISIAISNGSIVNSRNQLLQGDFTDKVNNQPVCLLNQFHCFNGPCINQEYRCNGLIECPQGDDEQSCPPLISPTENDNCAYQCRESKRCIPRSLLCDGKIQCLLADDELHCNFATGQQSVPQSSGVNPPFNQAIAMIGPEKQSNKHSINSFDSDKDGSDYVFVNFGPIINGDKNVNGDGNKINNGNGNGNGNGNANGNNNGNNNTAI